jgi:hypothetical protein
MQRARLFANGWVNDGGVEDAERWNGNLGVNSKNV